ncbi:MAG: spondin domain-containing protein [Planctomycetota bacterium]
MSTPSLHRCLVPLALAVAGPALAQSTATYRVTFDSVWSAATHPASFPPDPHYSPLVGATHNADATLWEVGGLASNGIEVMAEIGSPTPLLNEIAALAATGVIGQSLRGDPMRVSPGRVTIEFETGSDHPLLTMVTMIAPSPDWFVGTQSLSLRDGNGWIQRIDHELWPYDAGTDSGSSYTSPNFDTQPQEPIARIASEFPFTGTPALGTYTIELIDVECTADFDGDGDLSIFDFLAYQNAFDAGSPLADLDGDGSLTLFDFLAFQNAFDTGC